MDRWNELPDNEIIEATVKALIANGINAMVAATGAEAKEKSLSLIPPGSVVMAMSSVTTQSIGLTEEIDNSGRFDSVRKKLMSLDREKDKHEMKILGAAPAYTTGSVHAVTQDGHVLIASRTGSQLPAYVYGADHVIWIVGAQKIVKDTRAGMQRIYEYVLPLEDARMRKAHGVGSDVDKLLIINKEFVPGRITLILVKEKLGF